MSRWFWLFSELTNRLWYRSSLYGIFAVITALVSIYAKKYIPYDLPQKIGVDALDSILNILASSMLAVTIFSLSTMVSAYAAATSNLTPRATKLLIEDKVSHSSLSTFLGSFIYSIVCIIALKTGIYGDTGRVMLFVVTIIVILLIVVTLLRWIEYLARLGRVGETIIKVEKVASNALMERLEHPYLGGEEWTGDINEIENGSAITIDNAKYIQHIDMGLLADIAKKNNNRIYITSMPGKLANPSFPLAIATNILDEDLKKEIRKAFITADERNFRQDPRFGLSVLSEIAIRALSPAINDPGTAIACLASAARIFLIWRKKEKLCKESKVDYPNVFVCPQAIDDIMSDFFAPVARDGAGIFEVSIRLQKTLKLLHDSGPPDLQAASKKQARMAMERSLKTLQLAEEKETLMSVSLN